MRFLNLSIGSYKKLSENRLSGAAVAVATEADACYSIDLVDALIDGGSNWCPTDSAVAWIGDDATTGGWSSGLLFGFAEADLDD